MSDLRVDLGESRTDQDGLSPFYRRPWQICESARLQPGHLRETPGWHDDTSDGPVEAVVKIGTRSIPADSAWIVTAPPNYSPDLVTPQTMYDVIRDTISNLADTETRKTLLHKRYSTVAPPRVDV